MCLSCCSFVPLWQIRLNFKLELPARSGLLHSDKLSSRLGTTQNQQQTIRLYNKYYVINLNRIRKSINNLEIKKLDKNKQLLNIKSAELSIYGAIFNINNNYGSSVEVVMDLRQLDSFAARR